MRGYITDIEPTIKPVTYDQRAKSSKLLLLTPNTVITIGIETECGQRKESAASSSVRRQKSYTTPT